MKVKILSVFTLSLFVYSSLFGWLPFEKNYGKIQAATKRLSENETMNLSGGEARDFLKKQGIYKSFIKTVKKENSPDELFSQQIKFRSSPPVANAFFGNSVAASGDTAIVGASFEGYPTPPGPPGAAYIFERNAGGANNWGQVKRLAPSGPPPPTGYNVFGESVAISGDTAVVSAPQEFTVYVFERNAGGANNWGQVKKLTGSDGVISSGFLSVPRSVAIEGDTIIAGSSVATVSGQPQSGAIYVFERNVGGENNWGQVKKIVRSDNASGEAFAQTVGLSGDTIVATARADDIGSNTDQGSAYVFERNAGGANNWGQVKKLTASDGSANDQFGRETVGISGNTIVVGAGFARISNISRGAAYIFERNAGGADNWGETKKLTDANGAQGDYFGGAVGISGDKVIVGARVADTGSTADSGAVFIFERNRGGADNWGQSQRLSDTNGSFGDGFGNVVALSGKTLLLGAFGDDVDGTGADVGSAFIFVGQNDTWSIDSQPLPASCTVDDQFGWSVSVSGDTAVVGAPSADVGTTANAGAAYIFYRNQGGANNWGLVKTLVSTVPTTGDNFGWSVAVSGDRVFVGAPYTDFGFVNSGTVFGFERNNGGADNWGAFFSTGGNQDGKFTGWSVSVSGDTLIAGSPGDDIGVNANQGSARVVQFDQQTVVFNIGITAADGASGDFFGVSVALNADTAVVSATGDDNGASSNQGAAYIFDRNAGGANNWGETKKLIASDTAAGDQFGASSAVNGDTIVIGTYFKTIGANLSQGAAYVFSRNAGGSGNWGEVKKLSASDGAAFDWFGVSVSVSGDTVVVGSWFDRVGSNGGQGSAYIFKQNAGGADNWGQIKKLVAADGTSSDLFGKSVALDSGNTLLIGASNDEIGGTIGLGSSYVFTDTGADWIEQAKPLPSLPANCGTDDSFGFSVAISGDTAVIGANKDDIGINTNQGSVYVLERNEGGANNWGLVKVLIASDGASEDRFGTSVSISSNIIIVGAPYKTEGANAEQGAAYVFERNNGGTNNWGEVKKLTASDAAAGDRFGFDVAVSGTIATVTSPRKNSNQGAAYVFEKNAGGANNWGETKILVDPAGAANEFFGYSAAISGTTVVIGVPYTGTVNFGQGAAQIFERNAGGPGNWGRTKTLTAADGAAEDEFGWDVGISNSLVVVSADGDDGALPDEGSAYIFYRNQGGINNWGQVKKIRAGDAGAGDRFGYAVSIFGDAIIAGSISDDIGANANQGSAYIFEQNVGGANNWGQVQKLTDPNGGANYNFGNAVAVSGDDFLVGAYLAVISQSPRDGKSAELLPPVQQGSGFVFRGNALAPTAASVTIGGRVMTTDGRGISRARVSLTAANGETRTFLTNLSGYYRFDEVPAGETYVFSVSHKIYQFAPQILTVMEELTDVNFTADD